MKRKTILTSAILALLAVGQGHADNSFVVKDSNTGKKQLEGKLSTVSRILRSPTLPCCTSKANRRA